MKRVIAIVFAGMVALLPTIAPAGSSEAAQAILPANQVATFSNRVQKDLTARGAHVAIAARKGRDPRALADGIK